MIEYLNGDGTPWEPAFPGQRPPFQAGHKLSVGNRGPLTHGANSPRHVNALAAQIVAQMKADIDYLDTPRFSEPLWKYGFAAAVARLYGSWVDTLPMEAAATNPNGGDPPLEVLRKFEVRAANLSDRLGLNPATAHLYAADIELSLRTLRRRHARERLQADLHEAIGDQP